MRQLFAEFPSAVDTLTGVRLDPHSAARDRISAARAVVQSVVSWKGRVVDEIGDREEHDLSQEISELVRDMPAGEVKRRLARLGDGFDIGEIDDIPQPPVVSTPATNGHQPEPAEEHPSIRRLVDVLTPVGLTIDDVADLLADALAGDENEDDT